jgi:prepilin-type N-terminal cleavage/methylation domain-containing protein
LNAEKMMRNHNGFTLIEIIAVLVILGILSAVAIPKYIDMRKDSVIKAVGSANTELNSRERLKLAEWKLKDGIGPYPDLAPAIKIAGNGETITGPDTALGSDWNSNTPIATTNSFLFQGKTVSFRRHTPDDTINEPYYWTVSVLD